ncbi:MAG: YfhO family protein [Myxococcales bacterium]|nr:YfhO family protein [Myxococcales bacterium]
MTPLRDGRAMRRVMVGGVLCLVAAVVWLHREVLLGGMVYHMDDAADGYYPSRAAIWRALSAGELPTWERGAWSGFPLLAVPYYGAVYPLSAIFYGVGLVRGLGWSIALHSVLCAFGMLLLLRRRGLGEGPALLGAAALALSTFMVERIRHIIFPQLVCWLPWVLCAVEGYLQTGRRRELTLLAGSLGLMLLCGALPLLPFAGLVLSAYVLPRVVRERPRALLPLSLAALVGLLLSMAQVVPTLAHLPLSPRRLGVSYEFASSYAWPDYRYLVLLVAPDFFGGAERGRWLGAYNHWELAGWYVGILPVLLSPLGVLRRRPELYALAGVALLAVALAFGDATPVHRWFFHHVPVYGALRCPARALVMFLVAVPILAAEGLQWLLQRPERGRHLARGMAMAGAGLALGVALYVWLRRPLPQLGLLATAMRHALGHAALVLCAGLAVGACIWQGVLPRRWGGVALAALTTVDLLVTGRGYVQPRPADWAPGTDRFAAVEWLLAQRPQERFVVDPQGPFRLHNVGMTYGMEGVGGYESFSIWRYVHLLYVLNTGRPYPYAKLRHDPAAGEVRRFDSPLLDLLNVRWYIGPRQPAPDWIERFRPPPGAPPRARHEPLWDPLLRVYENPHPLPRAFVVYEALVEPDEERQVQALAQLDPRRTVLLPEAPVPPPAGPRPLTPARLTHLGRDRLRIEAEAEADGVLVVSEPHYPGWQVTVDGRPAPLLRGNYALRAVALPAGRHVVEMRLVSWPARAGLLLSGLGLLLLLPLGLAGRGGPRGQKGGPCGCR